MKATEPTWCSANVLFRPLASVQWCVLDLETTGLDPTGDAITEFAALVVDGQGRLQQRRLWASSAGADALRQQVAAVAEVVARGAVVVAHNASFDFAFLQPVFAASGHWPWLCSMRLAGGPLALDDLAERLSVPVSARHTALGDATTLSLILSTCLRRAADRELATVAELAEVWPVARIGRRTGAGGPALARGWEGVAADLDLVVPVAFADTALQLRIDAVAEGLASPLRGPASADEHEYVVTALSEAGVTRPMLEAWLAIVREEGLR